MQNRGARWGWVLFEGAEACLWVCMIVMGQMERMILAALCMALLSPWIGAVGDGKGHKRTEFLVLLILGFLGVLLAAWTELGAMYLLAILGFSAAGLLHGAFLTDVSDEAHMELISSLGSACFLLCGALVLWIVPSFRGPKVVMGFTAAGTAVFSIPFLLHVRHRHMALPNQYPLPREVLHRIRSTAVPMAKNRKIRSLVLAAFFCAAAMSAVLVHGAWNGKGSGWILLPALLCLGASGLGGRKWNGIQILAAWIGLCLCGCLLDLLLPGSAFMTVGALCFGIRALVRGCFARIIPRDQSTAYFGIFGCLGCLGLLLGSFLGMVTIAPVLAGLLFCISGAILLYRRRGFAGIL